MDGMQKAVLSQRELGDKGGCVTMAVWLACVNGINKRLCEACGRHAYLAHFDVDMMPQQSENVRK